MVIDNGEDVLLNLKNPKNKRVRDPDSNNALVIEFNTEEDLEIEIPKIHSKEDSKNSIVVCLDLKNLAGTGLRIDVEVLGEDSNLKEVRSKNCTIHGVTKRVTINVKHVNSSKKLNESFPGQSPI